ncbi:MAG: ABC transporter ATP-binding protein [Actinomycetota bacterium]|nr:ABC transporter ATP-binding protein [Actinomycetota bacterium]MDQ3351025.1 ABC transporter ATP-binding protein [Actinomycetota bacterium]
MTSAVADTRPAETGYAIELRDIVKRFPGVVANDGVDLKVRPGTVHAIVGENGAGKSTLMKTLYGAHQPDEGEVLVRGTQTHFRSPSDAIRVGIGMVFQHFMLAENFTVWENIVLGSEPGTVALNSRAAKRRIRELSEQYGLDVDPDDLVADIGVGDKQRVEILKVLYRGAEILILDEPTAVLVPHEVDELFGSLEQLTGQGATVIFISHKLDEVLENADAITVLRAGKTVGEVHDPSQVTARELAEMMVGSELPSPETREATVRDETRLDVRDLTIDTSAVGVDTAALAEGLAGAIESAVYTGHKPLDDVSFSVRAGEIVGIAGVEGNGQSELIEAIMGLRPATGTILLDGIDISRRSNSARREAGLGYVAEDRQRDGMVLSMSLWENVILGHQTSPMFSSGGLINRDAARERTARIVDEFDVRTPGIDVSGFTLSGGNQQKLIVGREMLAGPRVLVAAHPTRGVDVGAQAVIWDILRDARTEGLATLLISADLDELIGLSDRLVVMLRGRIVAELDPQTVTAGELGGFMTGAHGGDGDAGATP